MSNRKRAEKHAIEASAVHNEEPKVRPRKRRSVTALYNSWGGQDADFFFRWAEASIGFKAQAIEKQAETIGKRPTEFWDDARVDEEKRRRRLTPETQALLESVELAPAPAARPNHGRQQHVTTEPDRTRDEHLAAARRYRRVEAGMLRLRTKTRATYEVLCQTFLPKRTDPEIEREWGQLARVAMGLERIRKAHAAAEKDGGVTLETWLIRRIERQDQMLTLAREEAEELALAAVRAYEEIGDKPPELVRAEREAAEEREPTPRRPKRDTGIPFLPEPEPV